jgi:hypothetical protein
MKKHQFFLGSDFSAMQEKISSFGRGKRVLTLMVFLFASFSMQAANGSFGGGNGTSGNPYLIEDAADLDAVRNNLAAHYNLANNIDLTSYLSFGGAGYAKWGIAGWQPIGNGTVGNLFYGSFNGAGYKVTGLWINRPNETCVGLFGYITGAIFSNLGVETAIGNSVVGDQYVGGAIGYIAGFSGGSNVTNSYFTGTVIGNARVGGFTGYSDYSTISGCYSTGNVISANNYAGGFAGHFGYSTISYSYSTCAVSTGGMCCGGLIGETMGIGTIVNGCYATGNIMANGLYSNQIGGLIGVISSTTVTNSYATGNVSTIGERAGGLVGQVSTNSSIKYCYASGNVIAEDMVGGLVGQDGNVNYSIIQNCMAVNDSITILNVSSNYINRIVGYYSVQPISNVSNIYADSNTIVCIGSSVVTRNDDQFDNGTSTNAMYNLAFYTNAANWNMAAWNINPPSGIWNICDGLGLPFLRMQGINCPISAHNIFAQAGTNGTITPSGNVAVNNGSDQIFTFAANSCYIVDSLWIDGVYASDSIAVGSYTFKNVIADHKIKVSFKEKTILTVLTVGVCSKDLYVWKGKLLYQSGTYYDTLKTANGCDSILQLDLAIHPSENTYYTVVIHKGTIYSDDNFTNLTYDGWYYVTYQTIYGCDSFVFLNLVYMTPPELCMVSVNKNNKCELIWKRKGVEASYNIYREGTQSGQYNLIGNVSYDSLNKWVDATSTANIRSYRYKVAGVDASGNVSDLSPAHKTIHLTISTGFITKSWNLIWNEYEGTEISTYNIYRSTGNNVNNLSWVLMVSLPGGNTSYTDLMPPSGNNLNYLIEAVPEVPCVVSKSLSAIKSNIASTKMEDDGATPKIAVYPNPTTGQLIIDNGELVIKNIELFDVVGKLQESRMSDIGKSEIVLDISHLSAGIYFLKVDGKMLKVVKQ